MLHIWNPTKSLWVHADMWVVSPGLFMWLLSREKCSCIHVGHLLCEIPCYHSWERMGGGAYLLFASYQGWKSGVVKMQKQEIMTPLYKFNEYILLWSQSGIRHILTGPTMSRWSPGRCVGACVFCVRQKFFFLFVWMFFWLAFTCFSNAWNRVIFVNRIIMPGDGRLQINGGTISLTAIIST